MKINMRIMMLVAICAVTLFWTVTIGYSAQDDWRTGAQARANSAKGKIENGIKQGSLTKNEADQLHRNLDEVLRKIEHMKSDGALVPKERNEINRDLDKLEKRIFKEKHDVNSAPRRRPPF